MMNDTITAISSGLTEAGIGIIRISGPESYKITDRIFRSKKGGHVDLSEPNRVHYGFIIPYRETLQGGGGERQDKNVSRETLDEVLVINMRAPHTYTGEDTIEIDCHGGVLMMRRILENVIAAGARPAEPGEFTKRAFLNGRIDLSQAEAVIDVITAKNDNAIRASVSQLRGSVSECIGKLRSQILSDTAYIESALDDPEHYSLDGFSETLRAHAKEIISRLDKLIESHDTGKIIREGINTVIIGKPNAGKSSLLNALLGEERAIVTQTPGTTRDTINESILLGGITLNLMDTAGIRQTDDEVERIGVERALRCAENADLILLVADLSRELDKSDEEIFKRLNEIQSGGSCENETIGNEKGRVPRILTVFNKSDLPRRLDTESLRSALPKDGAEGVTVSAKNKEGTDELCDCIKELFALGKVSCNDQLVISSERQLLLLKAARESMAEVIKSIELSVPEDMYTIDLMNAYTSLGQVIGEETGEDLINEIFSRFCMGK